MSEPCVAYGARSKDCHHTTFSPPWDRLHIPSIKSIPRHRSLLTIGAVAVQVSWDSCEPYSLVSARKKLKKHLLHLLPDDDFQYANVSLKPKSKTKKRKLPTPLSSSQIKISTPKSMPKTTPEVVREATLAVETAAIPLSRRLLMPLLDDNENKEVKSVTLEIKRSLH